MGEVTGAGGADCRSGLVSGALGARSVSDCGSVVVCVAGASQGVGRVCVAGASRGVGGVVIADGVLVTVVTTGVLSESSLLSSGSLSPGLVSAGGLTSFSAHISSRRLNAQLLSGGAWQ